MSEKKEKPRVIGKDGWEWCGEDKIVPGCFHTNIISTKGVGSLGLYFMPPGVKTDVFSLDDTDDGTADEYFGPCHEFYYILVGEFTMYWGENTDKVRAGTSARLILKAGDLGFWAKGWKYSVENTGKVPGTFFWGLNSAPEGTKIRDFTGAGCNVVS